MSTSGQHNRAGGPPRIVSVLMVEDGMADAALAKAFLKHSPEATFEVTHVTTVGDAIGMLAVGAFDAILLDLTLPDSEGLATLEKASRHAKDVPIVVVTGADREKIGLIAVEQGAQEFLPKGELADGRLARTIIYAVERHRRFRNSAFHDPLTGLANRDLLADRLSHVLARIPRDPKRVGVLFLDLDGFKSVNDRFGHLAGDDVLVQVAERLRLSMRPSDTLARFGGDEFVAVIENLTSVDHATDAARRLVHAFDQPFRAGTEDVLLGASVGVAVSPVWAEGLAWEPAQLSWSLVSAADDAMYAAKRAGGGVRASSLAY